MHVELIQNMCTYRLQPYDNIMHSKIYLETVIDIFFTRIISVGKGYKH